MKAIKLPANQPADRFYLGGPKIQEFRGEKPKEIRSPEDWVGSCTPMAGHETLGMTKLEDGELLWDKVKADAEFWLGKEHLSKWGVDPMILVKLLDAGQRLPIHAHPNDEFAEKHCNTKHGKAEAWYVLHGGEVYLGFNKSFTHAELHEHVINQNVETMLESMHKRIVETGDTIYVPPGVVHAIGEGVFVAEVQQPEDLSILMEWQNFELDGLADGHLGLGFDLALEAVERKARDAQEIDKLILKKPDGVSVLSPSSKEYFAVQKLSSKANNVMNASFGIVIISAGEGILKWNNPVNNEIKVSKGESLVVPHGLGDMLLEGDELEVIVCRPPL